MTLYWSPIAKALHEQITSSDNLVLVIAPFIQLEALKELVKDGIFEKELKIVTRWTAHDIISGVSDIYIYPFLKSKNIPLYINESIHLKLFVFESNKAFHTSGNITAHGLGLIDNANIEVGGFVGANSYDWQQIYQIIENSVLVTDEIFEEAVQYYQKNKDKKVKLPELQLVKKNQKEFSLNCLPAFEDPITMFDLYANPSLLTIEGEQPRRCLHDIVRYNVPLGLRKDRFLELLKKGFIGQSFIQSFIAALKDQKSMRFGAVTDWIHSHCTDVPLPYRWVVKENVAILYRWLCCFLPEITWDVPGKRSQVIYWQKNELDIINKIIP